MKYKAYLFGGPIKDDLRVFEKEYSNRNLIEEEIIINGCLFKWKNVPTLGKNSLKYEFIKKIQKICFNCDGEGHIPCEKCMGTGHISCHICNGKGQIPIENK